MSKDVYRDLAGTEVITEEQRERDPLPKDVRIVVPDEKTQEAVLKRIHKKQVCGECAHFDLRMGQEEYVNREGVFLHAYYALEHDPAWYGRTDMYGACHQWDGHMPHAMAPIMIPSQFTDSSLPYEQRDQPIECPYYRKRKHKDVMGSRLHYVGKRRNYE